MSSYSNLNIILIRKSCSEIIHAAWSRQKLYDIRTDLQEKYGLFTPSDKTLNVLSDQDTISFFDGEFKLNALSS